jgi:chromosomal replication initiation ATPase DnaA
MTPGALADLRDQVEMLSRRVRALENNTRDLFTAPPPVAISDVIEAVATEFEVTALAITSCRRDRQVVLARQVVINLCIDVMNMTVSRVARAFSKDRATVRHAYHAVWTHEARDPNFRSRMENLRWKLKHAAPHPTSPKKEAHNG